MQSTKPQTLAYSLADSPVGLLAWIYEKLVAWTDDYPWTEDEGPSFQFLAVCVVDVQSILVLTWIHIYLLSNTQSTSSAATSIRIYYEANKCSDRSTTGDPRFRNATVPMGISIFPRELLVVPTL